MPGRNNDEEDFQVSGYATSALEFYFCLLPFALFLLLGFDEEHLRVLSGNKTPHKNSRRDKPFFTAGGTGGWATIISNNSGQELNDKPQSALSIFGSLS